MSKYRFYALYLFSVLFLGGLFMNQSVAKFNESPEILVRQFQQDYMEWNDQAFSLRDSKPNEYMDLEGKAWRTLLTKYTLPDFVGEPIAFGSESSHDPNKEKILSVKNTNNIAVVTTQYLVPDGYSPIHEYHLIFQDGRWYLTQVYLADEGQLYPGL